MGSPSIRGAPNTARFGQISDFRPLSRYMSETVIYQTVPYRMTLRPPGIPGAQAP